MAEIYLARSRYVRERVMDLVAQGLQLGQIAPDTPPDDVVDSVLGLIWALTKGVATAPTAKVRDQIVRSCDLLLQAPPWWIDTAHNETSARTGQRRLG
jgi:hypothetical protein